MYQEEVFLLLQLVQHDYVTIRDILKQFCQRGHAWYGCGFGDADNRKSSSVIQDFLAFRFETACAGF